MPTIHLIGCCGTGLKATAAILADYYSHHFLFLK